MVDYNRNILLVYTTRLGFSLHFFQTKWYIRGASCFIEYIYASKVTEWRHIDIQLQQLADIYRCLIYLFTKLHATVIFDIVWYVSTYENCKFLFIYFLFFRFWLLICCFVSYHKKTFVLSCWCDYILVDLYSAAYVIMYLCFQITLIVSCLFWYWNQTQCKSFVNSHL